MHLGPTGPLMADLITACVAWTRCTVQRSWVFEKLYLFRHKFINFQKPNTVLYFYFSGKGYVAAVPEDCIHGQNLV